jgi:hypothetical protein
MRGARLAVTESGMWSPGPLLPLSTGCHVIQRERPQPFPAMSRSACGGFWRPRAVHGPAERRRHALVGIL